MLSLIIYAIGGFSGFILNNIYLILVGRALLGISVAGIMTISTTLVGDYFTGVMRNKFIGLQGAFMGFGGVVFVSIAGILADIKWNLPFLIYLLSMVAFITGIISLKENPRHQIKHKILSATGSYKLEAVKVYAFIFIGIVFFYMMPVQLPFLLDKLENMTNSKIGLTISLMNLSSAVVSLNYKSIKKWFNYDIIFLLVLLFMGCGYIMIAYCKQYSLIVTASCVSGLGVGLLMPLGNLWIMQLAPENKRGAMVGNVATAIYLGQFLSPLLLQPIVNFYSVESLFFLAGNTMLVLAAIIYIATGIRRKKSQEKINSLELIK